MNEKSSSYALVETESVPVIEPNRSSFPPSRVIFLEAARNVLAGMEDGLRQAGLAGVVGINNMERDRASDQHERDDDRGSNILRAHGRKSSVSPIIKLQ